MSEPIPLSHWRGWARSRAYGRALAELRRRHEDEYQDILDECRLDAEAEALADHQAHLSRLAGVEVVTSAGPPVGWTPPRASL